jgi:hypothetical protein
MQAMTEQARELSRRRLKAMMAKNSDKRRSLSRESVAERQDDPLYNS